MDSRDYKVNYQCPKCWDDLAKTDDPKVKHCDECKKDVHFCEDTTALKEANMDDLCVAVLVPEDIEDAVMMGDIDWSGFEGEPPEPMPAKLEDDPLDLDKWINDKPGKVHFREGGSNDLDIDDWLEGDVDTGLPNNKKA